MDESTKDKAKGTVNEVKGKVKEELGHATDNPNLENEGKDEKTVEKVQKKIGDLEKAAGV